MRSNALSAEHRSAVFDSLLVEELYATFSPISRLGREERERLLDGLGEIAERQSGGSVDLYITTPIYTARRKARTRGSA